MRKFPIKSLSHFVTSPFTKGVKLPYILVIIACLIAIFFFSKASSLEEQNKTKYETEKSQLIESIKQKRQDRKELEERQKKIQEDFIRLTSQWKQADEYLSGSINQDKEKLRAIHTLIGTADSEPKIADPGYSNISLIPTTHASTYDHQFNSPHSRIATPSTKNNQKQGTPAKSKKLGQYHQDTVTTSRPQLGSPNGKQGDQKNKQKPTRANKKPGSQKSTTSIESAKSRKKDKYFWKVYSIAIPVIQKYEGLRLRAYPDGYRRGRQLYSIGWGTRSYAGEVITQAEANRRLASIVRSVVLRIRSNHPNLTARQQAGLVSFAYNCEKGYKDVLTRGLSVHRHWCKTFLGKKRKGLVKRRTEEARMIFE